MQNSCDKGIMFLKKKFAKAKRSTSFNEFEVDIVTNFVHLDSIVLRLASAFFRNYQNFISCISST